MSDLLSDLSIPFERLVLRHSFRWFVSFAWFVYGGTQFTYSGMLVRVIEAYGAVRQLDGLRIIAP